MSLNSFLKATTDPRFRGLLDSSLYFGAGLAVPPLPVIDPNSKRSIQIAAKLNAISPEEFQRRTREYEAFAQKDYNHEPKKTENERSLTVALWTAPVEEQKPPPIDENELTAPVEEQKPPPIDENELTKEERLLFYIRRAEATVDRYQLEAQSMILEAETIRRETQKVTLEVETARRDTQKIILEAARARLVTETARRDAIASLLEQERLKQAPTRVFGGDRAGNSAVVNDGYGRLGRGMLPPDSHFYGYDMECGRGDGGYLRDGGYSRDVGYTSGGDNRRGAYPRRFAEYDDRFDMMHEG
ncbi:hypothetical protein GALMADRAFT_257105 [Galerina marginata CBS 339.88]|uniref:Uncharacterized protein n=1 Tax=Galerina marginata (strain CBS 339.88) TaxID=685588 RepID=A0A067SBW7_GALM3|nr:hypothetical protein GALMADRAFT_257105 [Galerina marginata CBS 339.88]